MRFTFANKMNNEKSNFRQRHLESLSRIFGKRPSTTTNQADGTTPAVTPTKEWIDEMKAKGLAKDITDEMICVNVIDDPMLGVDKATDPAQMLDAMSKGLFIHQEFWRIGVNIPEDVCSQLTDPGSGELYGIARLKEGRRAVQIVPKSLWDVARQTIEPPK